MTPSNPQQMGLSLLQQVQKLQNPGGGAQQPGGMPGSNPIDGGFIAKLMSGNPGGLIGALMNRSSMPVNPGTPPPPGDPAYFPGGVGPMAGGAPVGGGGAFGADKAGMMGMLSKIFPGMGGG